MLFRSTATVPNGAAVEAEPENPTLLDSLGWVLYKRGRFAESRQVFERALELSGAGGAAEAAGNGGEKGRQVEQAQKGGDPEGPDPVLLDHMGDVLYRLNDRDAAGRFWERSRVRLAELGDAAAARDDLKPLRLMLEQKQRQLQAGKTVQVAPVVETPQGESGPATRPAQAGAREAGR